MITLTATSKVAAGGHDIPASRHANRSCGYICLYLSRVPKYIVKLLWKVSPFLYEGTYAEMGRLTSNTPAAAASFSPDPTLWSEFYLVAIFSSIARFDRKTVYE